MFNWDLLLLLWKHLLSDFYISLRKIMAFRSRNHWEQMANGLRQYATSTSPKTKAYTPSAGVAAQNQQGYKRFFRGDFVPVYVVLGMITVSLGLGLHTAMHQLKHNPHVHVKKQRRETLPEVVEPEHVVEEAEKFMTNSFFRKVAHVEEFDGYNHAVKDPTRRDAFAYKPSNPRERVVTLKDVGADPVQPKASS